MLRKMIPGMALDGGVRLRPVKLSRRSFLSRSSAGALARFAGPRLASARGLLTEPAV
jgi:hypothetical protein